MGRTQVIAGLLIGSAFWAAPAAFAQSEDGNRDLLIDKLERVQLNLSPKDPSRVAVTLRLADLLAERARLASMKEMEGGCNPCMAGNGDRKKALALYTDALQNASDSNKGKVLIQMGHLQQLQGDSGRALESYARVAREVQSPAVRAEAALSIGEIHFKDRNFKEAATHYGQVLDVANAGSRGLAAYRLAWCEFNQGHLDNAIAGLRRILQTPDLMTRTGAAQAQADVQFQEEVARDLSTFMARKDIVEEDLKWLESHSPEKARIAHLLNVGQEAARLGRNKDAIKALEFVHDRMQNPAERLSVLSLRAGLRFGIGDLKAAAADFEKGLALWSQNGGCGASDCAEPQRVFRRFVTEWNKLEKTKPSAELASAYEKYLAVFADDSEMALWGAQAARALPDVKRAEAFYEIALHPSLPADKKENVLLTRLEFAEESKDEGLRRRAYEAYLADSPKGSKSFEVRYQLAHMQYSKGENEVAVESLRALALDAKGDRKIRKQAADLSLDALVLLKDDARIETWSAEYAQVFGADGKDFREIHQKALLTKSAKLAEAYPEDSWKVLSSLRLPELAPNERVVLAKNRILIAERLKKLPEARVAVEDLLAQPNLTSEDREFALARKAWLAELVLDFDTALKASEKMAFKGIPDEQKYLKLAMFAELAGAPKSYYGEYMKATKDESLQRAVAVELVRKSKNPTQEMNRHRKLLEKDMETWSRLQAEAVVKGAPLASVKTLLKNDAFRATPSGRLLWRVSYLREMEPLKAKIAGHALATETQKKLAATIKARGAMLETLERKAAEAIAEGDWTAQVVALDVVARENDRFYQDLLSAPMPEGLTPEEEQQYLQILSQQAGPYQMKAEQAKVKLNEFWSSGDVVEDLRAGLEGELAPLVEEEVKMVKAAAPEAMASAFAGLENRAPASLPAVADVEAARRKVRENPFDRSAVESLLTLEKQAGNRAMAGYLESRLKGGM